jgi:hypothetical protein
LTQLQKGEGEFLKRGGRVFLKRGEGAGKQKEGESFERKKRQEENRGEEKDCNLSLCSLPPPFGSTPPPS